MKILSLLIVVSMHYFTGYSQARTHEGTLPPDSAVIQLITMYGEVFNIRNVSERDAARKELVSPAYFYHGMDGAPISLAGLTRRQTKNNFNVMADSVYDEVLYQFENTAVLIFKEWQHLTDKGVEKESINSVLIVMGKENGKWVVIADVIGMKPEQPVQTKRNR